MLHPEAGVRIDAIRQSFATGQALSKKPAKSGPGLPRKPHFALPQVNSVMADRGGIRSLGLSSQDHPKSTRPSSAAGSPRLSHGVVSHEPSSSPLGSSKQSRLASMAATVQSGRGVVNHEPSSGPLSGSKPARIASSPGTVQRSHGVTSHKPSLTSKGLMKSAAVAHGVEMIRPSQGVAIHPSSGGSPKRAQTAIPSGGQVKATVVATARDGVAVHVPASGSTSHVTIKETPVSASPTLAPGGSQHSADVSRLEDHTKESHDSKATERLPADEPLHSGEVSSKEPLTQVTLPEEGYASLPVGSVKDEALANDAEHAPPQDAIQATDDLEKPHQKKKRS
jgi:hypothetical protein